MSFLDILAESPDELGSNEDYPPVCVVTHPLSAAGENAARTLLKILSAITQVSLITANLPNDSKIRDRYKVTEVTRTRAAQSNLLVAALRFIGNQFRMCAAIVRQDEPVILFFGATSYILPIAWARLLRRTVIVEPRGDVPLTLQLTWERGLPSPVASMLAGIVRILERAGFFLSNRVVTYTPGMAEQLGLDPTSKLVYPHGARYVDTEHFSPKNQFEERDRTIGYIGRFDEEKGVRELAFAIQHLPTDVKVRFIGEGELSGWLRGQLVEEIDAGRVEIAGWVAHQDVSSELNQLKLLVLPSSPTEGLPTIVLEALACGTPVYATPVSGVPDVIRPGETGFHICSRDPETMAEEIATILNKEDLLDVSETGRKLIESIYSFEAAVDRYSKLFDSLCPLRLR